MNFIKRHYPVIIASGVYCFATAIFWMVSTAYNSGQFCYVLDDTYILMAMAKNFSLYGIWGVTKYAFTSSSSSLLWILLLSLVYRIAGVNIISPLIINVIAGICVCIIVYVLLRRYLMRSALILIVLLFLVFFTPFIAVTFCGMEHMLHLLIVIPFVYLSVRMLSKEKLLLTESIALMLLSLLLATIRYEGIFLVAAVCVLFFLRRRPAYAVSLSAISMLPVIAYGIFSVSKGWYFLPNSIILKGNFPNLSSVKGIIKAFGYTSLREISINPHLLVLVLLALAIYIYRLKRQKDVWEEKQLFIQLFVVAVLLHAQFAKMGWFFRYEAYLVGLGVFVIAVSLADVNIESLRVKNVKAAILSLIASAFFFVFISYPLVSRGWRSIILTPRAMHERYLEHLTAANFIKEYCKPGDVIAINDIGFIAFYNDVRILDIYGLASMEPLRKKDFNQKDLREWAEREGAIMAYLQTGWGQVYSRVPSSWIPIVRWKIPSNVVFGDTKFVWDCIRLEYKTAMIRNMQEYSKKLPSQLSIIWMQ